MRSLFVSAAALAALHLSAQAQTGSNAANQVGDFYLERVLTLGSIASPLPPTFPASVLTGFQNGTIELHQAFAYNSALRTLEQTAFVVPAKSPLPFPSPGSAPVGDHYIIQVDSATRVLTPAPAAVLVGHVISNDAPTPWGTITGAVVTLEFAYQGTGPATQFSGIIESISGLYGLYTPTAVGSFSTNASAQKCSAATLKGVYMFRLNGSVQTGPSSFGPFVDNGRFIADGNGGLTVLDAGNAAGSVFTNRTFPIAYVIDDYCSGTFQWNGASMDVQVSKDGSQVNMVFTSPSSVVANGNGYLQ